MNLHDEEDTRRDNEMERAERGLSLVNTGGGISHASAYVMQQVIRYWQFRTIACQASVVHRSHMDST